MNKHVKTLGMVVAVVVVAVVGLFVGSQVRDRMRPTPVLAPPEEFLKHALMPGAEFPDVSVFDAADVSLSCADLIAAGGVVLFIDPDCTPCTDMGRRWQHVIDDGLVDGSQVWAVSYHPRETIDAYAASHGFTFPIYEDRDRVFRSEYRVEHYPLEVVVGPSGLVRSASYDSVSPVDVAAITEWLGR